MKLSDSVSNKLDTDQNVEPDLGPNCRQRLSAEEKSTPTGKELNSLTKS